MVTYLREAHAAWRDAGGPEVMIADTFRSPRWAGGGRRPSSPLGALGWFCTDTATPLVAGSYVAARVAVDVACTAVDLVLDGTRRRLRPDAPARPPRRSGLLRRLLPAQPRGGRGPAPAGTRTGGDRRRRRAPRQRHPGRVLARPQVLYLSVHTDPDHQYPYFSGLPRRTREGAGHGTTRNLPLPPGTGDDGVLAAVEVACELADAFDPVAVVVSLGYDAAAADPLGQLAVTAAGYARLGALLGALDRPTVLLQEGGYALDHLGALAAGTLSAFVDARARLIGATRPGRAGPPGRTLRPGPHRPFEAPVSERLTREQAARLLQVTLPSSDGQVKRAYRRLAREHHPDRGGDVRVFHQLQAAFERLVEEDLGRPAVARGRPSRTPATAPRDASRAELDAIEVDHVVPDRPVRLHAALVASALARPHPAAVHPLRAASRAPGARLNRAAGVLATDLTATLRIEVVADDLGRPVVAIAITGGARRARRALERASLEGLWIRRRRTSSTELRSTLAPRMPTATRPPSPPPPGWSGCSTRSPGRSSSGS
jgi:hypothetical protein